MDAATFSLILQGGSFAVLVYLMLWGLPRERKDTSQSHANELAAKDKTIRELIDGYNARTDVLTDKHDASLAGARDTFRDSLNIVMAKHELILTDQRKYFRESLDAVIAHCTKEMDLFHDDAKTVADAAAKAAAEAVRPFVEPYTRKRP